MMAHAAHTHAARTHATHTPHTRRTHKLRAPAHMHPGTHTSAHACRRQVAVTMRLVWLRAVLGALFACTPSLVAVAVLAAHTVRGRPLDLQTALSVVAAVNLLRAPLFSLPLVLQSLQARVRVRVRVRVRLRLR